MTIALIRGRFLAEYECRVMSHLSKKHQVTVFSSLHPHFPTPSFPLVKLFSPTDLPFGPFGRLKMPILNRIFVDAHHLFGLENSIAGFDIAYCAETYYGFVQQCLNAKKQGKVKKVISLVWENIAFNNEGIWGRKRFKERAIREMDQFIAVTEEAKTALITEGCLADKISVIPMGVDIDKFKGERRKEKAKSTVLFVGRMVEGKGVLVLKKAIEEINLSGYRKKIEFMLMGKGPLENQFQDFENVAVTSLPYEKMPEVFQTADIFVLPSQKTKHWEEQFGMVLVEAMACGLPIITTKTGSIPGVVGRSGIFVEPKDSHDLASQIVRLADNPKLRKNLGEKLRERAKEKFDEKDVAEKLENVLEERMMT